MKNSSLGSLVLLAAVSLPWRAPAGVPAPALPAPQNEPDRRLTSVLTRSETRRLSRLAREWFGADEAYTAEQALRRRDRLRQRRQRTREDFAEEWERASEKHGGLLEHVGDLRAIFDSVYSYPRESGYGVMKSAKTPSGTGYSVVPPRGYRRSIGHPAVLVLPERNGERDEWRRPSDQFDEAWRDNDFASDAVLVYPRVADDLLLDRDPDGTAPTHLADEERIAAVLAPFGAAGVTYHLDRQRLLLDCSRGSSAFGLRLATYFPVLFAGVVLRHPTEIEDVSLESLSGTPVLLVKSEETGSAADELARNIEQLYPGSTTLVELRDSSHQELEDRIAAWASTLRRALYRNELALALNHDRFKKGAWIVVDRAEPLGSVAPETRPRLVAKVDRKANRISVQCRGISAFTLLLNDVLVDLDREVTVIVNGEVAAMRRVTRSLSTTLELMKQRRDPGYVFTARLPVTVASRD